MAADLEFPTNIEGFGISCDITVANPGRIGGRSQDLGIRIANQSQPYNFNRGQQYWSGEFEIAVTDRTLQKERGIIEAIVVDYLSGGKSLKIPISRMSLIDFAPKAPTTDLITRGNSTFSSAGVTGITFNAGTYFTVDDVLYMYKGLSPKNVEFSVSEATSPSDYFPEYNSQTVGTNKVVEWEEPYVVAILPSEVGMAMRREGTFAGPWTFPFVSQ